MTEHAKIQICLLPGTEEYAEDIKLFVDAMVYKLYKNQHKGHWEGIDIEAAYNGLIREANELHAALSTDNLMHIIEESADVSNFALILASSYLRRIRRGAPHAEDVSTGTEGLGVRPKVDDPAYDKAPVGSGTFLLSRPIFPDGLTHLRDPLGRDGS